MQQVERCLFDLRRGVPVVIQSNGRLLLVWPLEHLDQGALAALQAQSESNAALVVTRHRLASVGEPDYLGGARIRLRTDDDATDIIRWACAPDTAIDSRRIDPAELLEDERAALYLMRRALLIPAALIAPIAVGSREDIRQRIANRKLLGIEAREIEAYQQKTSAVLKRVSEADVPLTTAGKSRFVVFREADGMREHVAILIGEASAWNDAVPVRLHSACLTGDLFGSLRCDCGEQLRASVSAIAERGGGVLLYLAQEGRGIGLANKMRAYHLQDDGLDTVDADQVLGFGEDERQYSVAVQMLAQLDIATIDLLTNNPSKIQAVEQGGIRVAGRHAVYGQLTRENYRYLNAKATRSGHWLDSLLDAAGKHS